MQATTPHEIAGRGLSPLHEGTLPGVAIERHGGPT